MPKFPSQRPMSQSPVKSCAYVCSRNSLAALNTLYIFLGLTLIGVAAYSKVAVMKNLSLPILGGVIACGVFIFLTAMLGLIGAIRHNQVLLFFYLVIMSLLFIIQLSVSIAALAVTSDQQHDILKAGWHKAASAKEKSELQTKLDCCGFETVKFNVSSTNPSCSGLSCCVDDKTGKGADPCLGCTTCYKKYKVTLEHALSVAGGVGLFFAFTLLMGIYLAIKYRNQKDPAVNLDAFL
ncbi:tetraspanin-13-like [Rhopilema esculentum]|uniref:tetraspanin-13-like n=1 Tax=Rhopilema esculentum TaxID=499914 RepID=UPI0031D30211|eukprot:gene14783-5889_t